MFCINAAHAQGIMGNGVTSIPPYDSSIRYVGFTEWRKLKIVSFEQ
jgi:hypothetical protein